MEKLAAAKKKLNKALKEQKELDNKVKQIKI